MPPKSYYAVRQGVKKGIFRSWEEAKGLVLGFRGAEYKGFETQGEAVEYMGDGVSSITISEVVVVSNTPILAFDSPASVSASSSSITKPKPKLPIVLCKRILPPLFRNQPSTFELSEIYVDSGQNSQTGVEAWGCVVDAGGRDLIAPHADMFTDIPVRDVVLPIGRRYVLVAKFPGVTFQQNNSGELLATVAGLRLAMKYPAIKVVKGDSTVVLTWWSRHLGADKRKTMDKRKLGYIDELIELRRAFEARGGRLEKIDGKYNLADHGRHRG